MCEPVKENDSLTGFFYDSAMNLLSKKLLLIFAAIFILSSDLYAWGQIGHRVVGEIAEKNLKPQVYNHVKAILNEQPMADAAVWADDIRSDPQYEFVSPWHYVEIPLGKKYNSAEKNPQGDIIYAINQLLQVVTGKQSAIRHRGTNIDQQKALKLLIHFVGDIHQPFHVGNARDRGGNNCFVRWFGESRRGVKSWSLHAIWDDAIIDSFDLSFTELTRFLLTGATTKLNSGRLDENYLQAWADESREIQSHAYPEIRKYSPDTETPYYCKRSSEKSRPDLGYSYRYQFEPAIRERLLMAGLRLAQLLNEKLSR